MFKKILIVIGALAVLVLSGVLVSAQTAAATSGPEQIVTCDSVTVFYGRALHAGDQINITISGQQPLNAYIDLNIDPNNHTALVLRINGHDAIFLDNATITGGILVYNFSSYLTVPSWSVDFVQTNNTDRFYTLKCGATASPTPTPTPSETSTPTPTPTPSDTPTASPSPTSTPAPSTTPVQKVTPIVEDQLAATGVDTGFIFLLDLGLVALGVLVLTIYGNNGPRPRT